MATRVPKPRREKRRGQMIGTYFMDYQGRRVNLRTYKAIEAERRARLYVLGKWSPDDTPAAEVRRSREPDFEPVPAPEETPRNGVAGDPGGGRGSQDLPPADGPPPRPPTTTDAAPPGGPSGTRGDPPPGGGPTPWHQAAEEAAQGAGPLEGEYSPPEEPQDAPEGAESAPEASQAAFPWWQMLNASGPVEGAQVAGQMMAGLFVVGASKVTSLVREPGEPPEIGVKLLATGWQAQILKWHIQGATLPQLEPADLIVAGLGVTILGMLMTGKAKERKPEDLQDIVADGESPPIG